MKLITSTLFASLLFRFASAQPGTLDGSFNNSGTPGYTTTNVVNGGDDYAQAIAVHSDGRIVVAAHNENNYFTLIRYTSTGALDNTFGSGGIANLRYAPGDDGQAYAVTVLSNNKILVAGYSYGSTKDFALLRLNEDGTPDATFGTGGWAITPVGSGDDEGRSMVVQSDGKFLLAGISNNGSNNDFALVRYNSDGSLDNSFGTNGVVTTDITGNDLVESIGIQSDGKIVVGGTSNTTGASDFAAVRYNSDGSLDNSFGTGGIATVDIGFGGAGSTDQAHSLAIQPDGKILLVGQTAASTGGNDDVAIMRLTANGVLDSGASGFDGDGIVTFNYGPVNTDDEVRSAIIQNDGNILVAGSTDGTGSSFGLMMLRYTPNGTLDPTFGPGTNGIATADLTATADVGNAMALYGTRIYVAGSTVNVAEKQTLLAAFNNNYTTLPLTLMQFYAEKQSNKVALHWQTTAEENVKQFIVQSSSDGRTFKSIGYVTATDKNSTFNHYSYTDQLPFTGNNFYRLLIQDFDGNFKYSNIVSIRFGEELSNLQLYPCPAKEILQVQLPAGLNGTINLNVIDLYGHVVKTNNIASTGNVLSTSIDIHNLPHGTYILQIDTGNTSFTKSFIKQ